MNGIYLCHKKSCKLFPWKRNKLLSQAFAKLLFQIAFLECQLPEMEKVLKVSSVNIYAMYFDMILNAFEKNIFSFVR